MGKIRRVLGTLVKMRRELEASSTHRLHKADFVAIVRAEGEREKEEAKVDPIGVRECQKSCKE